VTVRERLPWSAADSAHRNNLDLDRRYTFVVYHGQVSRLPQSMPGRW